MEYKVCPGTRVTPIVTLIPKISSAQSSENKFISCSIFYSGVGVKHNIIIKETNTIYLVSFINSASSISYSQ